MGLCAGQVSRGLRILKEGFFPAAPYVDYIAALGAARAQNTCRILARCIQHALLVCPKLCFSKPGTDRSNGCGRLERERVAKWHTLTGFSRPQYWGWMNVYKGFNAASRQRGNCRPHEIVLVLQAGWEILGHAKNDHPGLIARVK